MKKYYPILIVLIAVLFMALSVILSSNSSHGFKKINFKEFKELLKSKDFAFIYIGNPNCSHCQLMQSSIEQVKTDLKIEAYYLNSADLKKDNIKTISKLDESLSSFGTPTFLFVKNKELVGIHIGSGVQDNDFVNIVKMKMEDIDYENITIQEFSTKFNSEDTNIIVVGKDSLEEINSYKSVINNVSKENNIKILYMNYESLTESDITSLKKLDSSLVSNEMPYTIITEGGLIIKKVNGNLDKSKLEKLLKNNSIID